jgi:hypothetical protein
VTDQIVKGPGGTSESRLSVSVRWWKLGASDLVLGLEAGGTVLEVGR